MKNLPLALILLLSAPALFAQQATTPDAPDSNYAFGILLGQSLATTGLDLNLEQVFLGIKDALGKGGTPRMNPDQAKEAVQAILMEAQEKANQAQIDKENLWLADHGKQKGVVTTASGLQYEVLTPGTGAKPALTDTVKVDYVGTLVDGTEFDNSIQRGEPAVFALDQVIPAWTEGIQLMKVGAKYRFTIPSSLAYGPQGAGEVIPPYSTLVFEVSLLSIEPPQASEPAPDQEQH